MVTNRPRTVSQSLTLSYWVPTCCAQVKPPPCNGYFFSDARRYRFPPPSVYASHGSDQKAPQSNPSAAKQLDVPLGSPISSSSAAAAAASESSDPGEAAASRPELSEITRFSSPQDSLIDLCAFAGSSSIDFVVFETKKNLLRTRIFLW